MAKTPKKEQDENIEATVAAPEPAAEPAKKEKPPKEKKPKKERVKGEGGGAKAFIIVFTVAVIGLAVAVLGFNAFNIRDEYLADSLRNVPIISNLLPPVPVENGEGADVPPETSKEEYEAQIARLERELAQALRQTDTHETTIEQNRAEISRLRAIEAQQEQFRADKREFDEMVIRGDPSGFAAFFERVAPETAEELYPTVAADAARQDQIDNFLSAISQQDEGAAAEMLEELIPTDLNLVVEILKGLSNRRAGAILSQMSAQNAATVTKRWAPIDY